MEFKHVDLPEVMQRAMAKQADAEREKRAKFSHAHGEQQAAENLALAAKELGKEPSSMQLLPADADRDHLGTELDVDIPTPGGTIEDVHHVKTDD